MILCICNGVRCSKVRDAIGDGAHSVEAVGSACGAGTDCGSCRGMIEDLIEEHLEDCESRGHGRVHLSVTQPAA